MWNSLPVLQSVAAISVVVGVIAGSIALAAGFVGTVASNRAAHIEKVQRDIERDAAALAIAQANARAEEARAEAVRAAERLRQLQQVRRLPRPVAEVLAPILRQEFTGREISVASVADTEARMYALDFIRLFESTDSLAHSGSNAPEEALQTRPHSTGIAFTYRIGRRNEADEGRFLRLHGALWSAGIEATLTREPDSLGRSSAAIFVLRKPDV